jgi:hypothetical protein
MFPVITNDVSGKRAVHEPLDCPTVLPVDTTICISEKANLYIRFVNRIESPHSVYESQDCREPNTNVRQCVAVLNEVRSRIRRKVDIHNPSREMELSEFNVLKKPPMINA